MSFFLKGDCWASINMVQVSQKDKMTPNLIADLWECKCKCKCKCKYSVVSLFCFKCLFF